MKPETLASYEDFTSDRHTIDFVRNLNLRQAWAVAFAHLTVSDGNKLLFAKPFKFQHLFYNI
jgi:hypothetical protein